MKYRNLLIILLIWIIGFLVYNIFLKNALTEFNPKLYTSELNNSEIFLHIFINNSFVIAILYFGLLSAGVSVILVNFINSINIYQMLFSLINKKLYIITILTLPHTILELIAIVIASNIGLNGIWLFKAYLNTNTFEIPKNKVLKNYTLSEILILVAAFLEVWSLNYINHNFAS
ncbi:stage II sporulation protein M [Prolixibacter sp. SD074]|uniref:stage II sporulation protein M n=1 Tax=Prolixibacter sp. SD074 TaxID=2652391 RepID=UPI001270277B|nr:hypothetical protein SD074_19520 [Prolixibacter sp. SD074]